LEAEPELLSWLGLAEPAGFAEVKTNTLCPARSCNQSGTLGAVYPQQSTPH
jgi:hypothetical protein